MAKGRPGPAWLKKSSKREVKSESLGPNGRRLKAVDSGQKNKFQHDDEFGGETAARARAKRLGGDGDPDEMEYESDFADDDEGGAMDAMDDEEAKELDLMLLINISLPTCTDSPLLLLHEPPCFPSTPFSLVMFFISMSSFTCSVLSCNSLIDACS